MRFDTLLRMADKLMLYKYVVKNVARAAGYTATFMPKPLFQDNGSGMHCHQSLWKDGEPLFYGETGYGGLSDIGRWYIGGLLEARPGGARLRGAHHQLLQAARARLRGAGQPGLLAAEPLGRVPDPALLAEPEGQAGRVPLPGPVVQPVPRLLGHADGGSRRRAEPDRAAGPGGQGPLRPAARGAGQGARRFRAHSTRRCEALEADHDFLKAGGVFTDDLIETWIELQAAQRGRRHPAAAAPVGVHALLRHLRVS